MVEQRVASFFDKLGLRPTESLVGVALSGGADSVALIYALCSLGWKCVALHCNFHLRGEESDRDARHAEMIARQFGCEFRSVDFDVETYRESTGASLEMACRELRYKWFEAVANKLGLRFIAIAHHADDCEETFFLNALRGTGLKGLGGISACRGIFVRPMLECSRQEVIDYLNQNGIDYVTDSSNLVDDVKRNKLRLNVLPQLHADFPSSGRGLARTMANLRSDCALLSYFVEKEADKYVINGAVNLTSLLRDFRVDLAENLLYRFLKRIVGQEGDFKVVRQIIASSTESGRYFDFGKGRLILDRGTLRILSERTDTDLNEIEVDLSNMVVGDKNEYSLGVKRLECELLPASAFSPNRDADTIWLDAKVICEPLLLRHPAVGDRIAPYGLTGTTLISKLMKDAKIPDNEKPRQWVLLAGCKLLWLCGVRCSKHFAVTSDTTKVVRLRIF